MSELTMIWDEVVSVMELELNNIQTQNWILPLRPVTLQGDTMILDATTNFIRRMVEKKYLDTIQEYTSHICNKPIKVQLIDPEQSDYYIIIDRAKIESNGQVTMRYDEETSEKSDYQVKQVEAQPSFLGAENVEDQTTSQVVDVKTVQTKAREAVEEPRFSTAKREKEEQLRKQNGYHTLNPRYTFENFVRGSSNDFAYAAASAVSNNPGYQYNPLFIYGGSGLGKTHLMQAIAHRILEEDPTMNVLYITSENFTNELVWTIERGSAQEKEDFRAKYRKIDVLLIDDIQFIANKRSTQEEIFHTFNALKEANKQIVLTSDKPPKELSGLEGRLVTRFEMGMTADINKPDFETRVAILNHKLHNDRLEFPQYIVEYIANNVTSNIRELEGALLRVIAFFRYKQVNPMSAEHEDVYATAREALQLRERETKIVTLEDIKDKIMREYGLKSDDFTSPNRQSSVAHPRQIAMYLSRKLTNLSLVKIAHFFERDHTTVMHGIDKITKKMENSTDFNQEVETLIQDLKDSK